MATSTREQLVAERLDAALRRLGLPGLQAEVHGRTVRLVGEVAHNGERRRALEMVRAEVPDYRLEDRLHVSPQGLERDETLQIACMQAFDMHDEMADQQMAVVVEGGVARLVGMVTRPALIDEAVGLIRSIHGIVAVETDELQTPAPLPAADNLATRLEAALALDPRLDAAGLAVSVTNNVAYLTGEVRTSSERLAAMEVAAGHPGVRQVIARIAVAGADPTEDDLLASAVRDKLPPGCEAWVLDGTAFLIGALPVEEIKLAEAVALAATTKVVSLLQPLTVD